MAYEANISRFGGFPSEHEPYCRRVKARYECEKGGGVKGERRKKAKRCTERVCEENLFSFSRPSSLLTEKAKILLPLNGRRGEERMQTP